jgi:hypothetical protein
LSSPFSSPLLRASVFFALGIRRRRLFLQQFGERRAIYPRAVWEGDPPRFLSLSVLVTSLKKEESSRIVVLRTADISGVGGLIPFGSGISETIRFPLPKSKDWQRQTGSL